MRMVLKFPTMICAPKRLNGKPHAVRVPVVWLGSISLIWRGAAGFRSNFSVDAVVVTLDQADAYLSPTSSRTGCVS